MPTLEEGQRFERYRVIRWLGQGVSSESYEAEDTILQRKVTLKLIHPWSTLPDSARRQFFREMQGISMLQHPYLAAMLDYGEIDGRLYVARRYVSNGSLLGKEGRMWHRPPFQVSEAIHYGHQLAQTLQHIHDQGFMHGAVTLSNILVLRGSNLDNDPEYTPFLLADTGLTHFVRRFGTPTHTLLPVTAAPEQLGKRLTPASDQFALATILYLWLAGRPPYVGSAEEIEQLKLTETIASLTALNPKVTIQQEVIIRHALAVYPEERYPSILAFTEALMATLTQPLKHTTLPDILLEPTPTDKFVYEPQNGWAHFTKAEAEQNHVEVQPAPILEAIPNTDMQVISVETISDTEIQAVSIEAMPEINVEVIPGETISNTTEPAIFETVIPQTDPDIVFEIEPLPQPEPDIAQPLPEATPETEQRPEIEPSPEVEPETTTEPESPPAPEPDIALPLPEPFTETADIDEDEQLVVSARLIIVGDPGEAVREIELQEEETTIGRAGDSHIFLDDSNTSRHHALIKHEGDCYVLYDRRSATGVYVNEHRLADNTGYVLGDRDQIKIGHFQLSFRYTTIPPKSLGVNENKQEEVLSMDAIEVE